MFTLPLWPSNHFTQALQGGEIHDIREDSRFVTCPDLNSYAASQKLARELLEAGAPDTIYPILRHK
jgi:hypothetical protein